ncbi:LacI family DNA-binding transcriptional regulator [Danxiaibacter flavus]|uniref:LacI family DNA-binding transcriptional regulator n=1 Tax=Danxiaibacter flavus TaxID=3049108 RepID=A0ABV3ZAU5_9BACT|nr:LacI family DNA-binding transcriptional regulator [Chitinophagaceae bacterium DXS]
MKFEAVTIKDIAKALNLSISSVSKALRGSHEISEETKKQVHSYARKMNYKPNPIAQGLRKGKSKSIGVVVTNIDNNFFSQVINGVESVAHKKEYNVVISQTHESYDREVLAVQNFAARSIDGLIISLSAETKKQDHFKKLHDSGLPMVFFDRVANTINTHKVTSNNFLGAYNATRHLIQQGYKRIAHITSANTLSITFERLEGYVKALKDYGYPLDEACIKYCDHGGMLQSEISAALQQLLSMTKMPDAIFTASDRLSTSVFSLLKSKHIKIPQQIAIIGFTNSISADIFDPPLSTISQPAYEMGQTATELLIRLIESRRPVTSFEKIVLDNTLHIRESSRRGEM